MQRYYMFVLLLGVFTSASANQTVATADTYNAVAYFTSGLVDGESVDRIDTAYLGEDTIVLYVEWDKMALRAYRTEVRIFDPNGELIGKVRNTIMPSTGRYYTYYYYRPDSSDVPGDWTYQMYVDGRNAFEARIPVLAAK